MADIARAVLSEHFQERMKDRRLRAAVFVTYEFDPGFFEQEILPVLIDIPLSHAAVIRLVQLEDALRSISGQIAVYYDANGLVTGDAGSAKLDIRRIPVQHRTGIFHAKNVLLLVEAEKGDEEGHRAQTLIVASLSANLTRAGWWENVEVCHIEEIPEGDKTRLKDDLVGFLESLRRKTTADDAPFALREIVAFLKDAESRFQKSLSGQLYTHFYAGREPLADFLEQTAGDLLHGTYLEIVSPYFDDAVECNPLKTFIERFQPKEIRVFLPRSASGEALCRREIYESVGTLGAKWGRLPKDVLRLGRSDDAGERFVHAKIYRFFTQNPKREVWFVGSANLTSAAHQAGGNAETGFLVDLVPSRKPEFWLSTDDRRPTEFQTRKEDEPSAASGGTCLNLRYHWDRSLAEVFWDGSNESPELRLEARGIEIATLPSLPSRTWTGLDSEATKRIADLLVETSLFWVHGGGDPPGLLLVQEEGMSHKPSLLMRLSTADILRYWSLLTAEQRTVFLETRASDVALAGQGADLVTRARIVPEADTLFDRFAGFFHAFGCLERAVRDALEKKREKEVGYRLFGKKYDSLGSLLDRVSSDISSGDDVDRYVIVLCARQLCHEIARAYPDYWSEHAPDINALEERFKNLGSIRQRIVERSPDNMGEFLEWFDRWFLRRAAPVEETGA